MSRRYYKPQPAAPAFSEGLSVLPTNRPIAVYYRQSTDAQIGNISTSIQTIDMVTYLKGRGWAEEDIHLIDMDAGVSGTTKIDERPGMSLLFDLITQSKIGAVACQDEDRLFRDVTQIQVNIFIEACRSANVLVLTPNMVYDFANELTGAFHARQFRFKSEMAADYIHTVIKGKLHRAKQRLLNEGRWAGFAMLPGYMVDIRKSLPDGSKNLNWRRYVPFPEYVEVVNEYFRLFLSYAGNLGATIKHIQKHGPYYPDPATCSPPDGFKFVHRMKRYGHGYCPARTGLENLLTNATLLGHWSVNGVIVRWNNHPAIVSEEVFWRAFNYLSPITLDGRNNPHFKPFQQHARPSLESERPKKRPLCAGMLVSQHEGAWKNVGTVWIKDSQEYIYVLAARHPEEEIIWRHTAQPIDEAIVSFLRERLRATFDENVWDETIANADAEYEEERRRIRAQIASLERVMESQILSLETLTKPDMVLIMQQRYEDAQEEHKRLSADLAATTTQSERIATLKKLKAVYDPTLATWEHLTRDEKRVALHTFVQRIEATAVSSYEFHLQVVWVDGKTNEVVLPKLMKNGWRTWLASDAKRLLELVDAGASQVKIASMFPDRTWKQIGDKIADQYGTRSIYFSPKPMHEDETYPIYVERTRDTAAPYIASGADKWIPEDEVRLLALLDSEASKLQFLEAFPYRRWLSMAKKLRSLRGKDAPLPQDKTILWKDTLATYREKIGRIDPQEAAQLEVSSETSLESTPDQSDARNTALPS